MKLHPYPKCPKCGLNITNYKDIIQEFLEKKEKEYSGKAYNTLEEYQQFTYSYIAYQFNQWKRELEEEK